MSHGIQEASESIMSSAPQIRTPGVHIEEGSRMWYRDMLLLADEGGVPGLPGGSVKASKADCVVAFGPALPGGRYPFRGRGSVEYKSYTLELLERTQQENVEHVNSLPFHFARGLLDEENGERVNWTLFALCRQHLHGRMKSISEYLLPKYKGLRQPIAFVHPKVPLGKRQPPNEVKNTPEPASEAFFDITSAGIPMPVRRGVKLLAPLIERVCKVVLAALEEENRASMPAIEDVNVSTLGLLKKRRASCSEELQRLQSSLSLQDDVYKGMFNCGEEAVVARNSAKRELKVAIQTNMNPEVIEDLKATEGKCYEHVQQYAQWCTIAKKTKGILQSRYEEEELALATIDNDIKKVQVLHDSWTPTADSRYSDVHAFMLFMSTT